MNLKSLIADLNDFLQPQRFADYCPNGLQIEGKAEVKRIITGVTASQALIDEAIAQHADAILVHHGFFWRGESQEIIGIKKQRIQTLLKHDISLIAYHLPLDAHAEVGNNVMLGRQLGFKLERYLDEKQMIAFSQLPQAMSFADLGLHIENSLSRKPLLLGDQARKVQSVAWCTGAAQQYIDQAILNAVDVFISGEVSEQTFHAVQESKTCYISAGHHATERYGVRGLGEWLAKRHGIDHVFVDIHNPI